MSDLSPREARRRKKALACVEWLTSLDQAKDVLRHMPTPEDVYDIRALIRAAYMRGWKESAEDILSDVMKEGKDS